jgi:hypothetical protein
MADSTNDYGNSIADSAISNGNKAVNSFDPAGNANSQRTDWGTLFDTQNNTQNDFLNSYNAKIASQPSLSDSYAKYGAANNLTGLGNQANTLNNAVLQTPQQNLDLAKGFNYNQNQVNQKTTQDLTKLQPLATAATNNFQTAQNLTNQQVGYQQTQNQYELQPLQAEQAMTTDAFARQMTGYTQANDLELQGLMSKMNAGVTLTSAELSRANTLATAQASYQSTIDAANINQKYKTLNPSQQLVNTMSTNQPYTYQGTYNPNLPTNNA